MSTRCFLRIMLLAILVSSINSNPLNKDVANLLIDLSHFGARLFGKADLGVGARLENWLPDQGNPEESGSYLEGDMLYDRPVGRNGLATQSSLWPGGVVPFVIAGSFNQQQLSLIAQAMEQYHALTCIQFVPRFNEPDYISIQNSPSGCWSTVGRMGGMQIVNLQTPACMQKPGTAMHELMHCVGFLHEQNREDRDDYIQVVWGNIPQKAVNNFEVASPGSTLSYGIPYDYQSIMHYSSRAFSSNGQSTIIPLIPDPEVERVMGQRESFAPSDIEKINRRYNCPAAGSQGPQQGFENPNQGGNFGPQGNQGGNFGQQGFGNPNQGPNFGPQGNQGGNFGQQGFGNPNQGPNSRPQRPPGGGFPPNRPQGNFGGQQGPPNYPNYGGFGQYDEVE